MDGDMPNLTFAAFSELQRFAWFSRPANGIHRIEYFFPQMVGRGEQRAFSGGFDPAPSTLGGTAR